MEGLEGVPDRRLVFEDSWYNPDTYTSELLDAVREHLVSLSGGECQPYWVKTSLKRRLVDLNRPVERACESDETRAHYEAYHAQVGEYLQEMWGHAGSRGKPFLYDLHGQGYLVKSFIRGTCNGETVKPHMDEYGEEFLTGDSAFFTCLEEEGFYVDPPPYASLLSMPEMKTFEGGYTVQRYGGMLGPVTHKGSPVPPTSCFQVECGSQLKDTPERRDELSKAIAKSILKSAAAFT